MGHCRRTELGESVQQRFSALMARGRLAHAYLLIGPEGVGKMQSALDVARLVNCERRTEGSDEPYCGQCPSCYKINAGTHPDVVVFDTGDSQSIRIEKIRELITKSQLSPFEAKRKVFIIKDTDRLTLEGSNALLKTLEEPSARSLLLLTTSVPEKNLETIRSRCHAVYFFPLSPGRLARQLRETQDVPEPESRFLAFFSEGCVGRARRLKDGDFFRRKNEMIDRLVLDRRNDDYLKAVSADRQQTKDALDVLLYWFRDLILIKQGDAAEGRIANMDRIDELTAIAPRYSFKQLVECFQEIVMACRLWGDNLNIKLPLTLIQEKIWVRS